MYKKIGKPIACLAVAALLFAPNTSHAEDGKQFIPDKGEAATANVDLSTIDSTDDVTVTVVPSSTDFQKSRFESIMPLISDPGGWQSRGKYNGLAYTGDDTFYYTPASANTNWLSGGGDFKIQFTNVNNSFTVQLREYDGADNFDEMVGEPVRVSANSTITWSGISQYVDGAEAEFYIATYNASPYQASFTAQGFD